MISPFPFPIYDFGGRGPVIHLSVANGFPPQTYKPMLDPLASRYHIISVLPRALWPEPPPPESLTSWIIIAEDILAGLHQRDLRDVILIGHSMGAVASVLAAVARPERFKAVILLDPTFLSPRLMGLVRLIRAIGQSQRIPLAQGALRRRAFFDTAEEAFDYWRAKPFFRDWDDRTLRLYVESMTRPAADGGVELAWPPLWEAQYYQTMFLKWRREVARLRGLLPVLAVQGGETDTFVNESVRIMRSLVPDATYARVEGHGHLFPQSAPDAARGLIEDWLNAHV